MVFFCLEGPPGIGKESLVRQVAILHKVPAYIYRVSVSDIADERQDEGRWSFYTQLRVLTDRVMKLRDLSSLATVVTNGSPLSDRTCHAMCSQMDSTERDLYDRWADVLMDIVGGEFEHLSCVLLL